MRILQISTNFRIGGIQRHVLDLTDHLRAQGHTVVLAGDDGEWRPENDVPPFEHLSLDRVAAMGGSIFQRVSALVPVARKLRKVLKKHDIQIIHAHETAPAIVARMASVGLGIPIVFTYHGSEPDREIGVATTARRCADMTVSPSKTSLGNLISHGLAPEKARVIGLGVHPPTEVSQEKIEAFRRSILGDEGGFLITSLSRLDQQKGIDMMIEVARKTHDRREDVKFAIAGGGPLDDLVQTWVEVIGVSENVKFLGHVNDIATVLAASDIYLLTSRWEALPISIVEAFQHGLPVVATDCGGVKELVDSTVGFVLPVGDTNGLSEALLKLIDEPELRRQMGRNARALSHNERFSPEAVHRSFEALYAEMLENPQAARVRS